jgi:hypothetical protein
MLSWFVLTFEEGERHPINRLLRRPAVRLAIIAAILGGMLALARLDPPSMLSWTPVLLAPRSYLVLFPALFALVVLLRVAPRHRRLLLVSSGIAFAAVLHVGFALGSLAYFTIAHLVVSARAPAWLKLAFLLGTFAALALVCDVVLWPGWLGRHRIVLVLATAFTLAYVFRIFYYFHERRLDGFTPVPLADTLAYFLFPPLLTIIPYMLCVPRFGAFRERLARP